MPQIVLRCIVGTGFSLHSNHLNVLFHYSVLLIHDQYCPPNMPNVSVQFSVIIVCASSYRKYSIVLENNRSVYAGYILRMRSTPRVELEYGCCVNSAAA